MLRYDKLTVKAQEALQAAQDIAGKRGQQQLEPLHLLAALVAQQDGVVPPLLNRLGVRPESLEVEIDSSTLPPAQGERRFAAVFEQGELTRFWKRRLTKQRSSRTNTSPPSTSCWPSRRGPRIPRGNC